MNVNLTTCAYPDCTSPVATPPACDQCRQPLTCCPQCGSTGIPWSRYCRACGGAFDQPSAFAWNRRPALSIWQRNMPSPIVATPLISGSVGFLVEEHGALHALSMEDGSTLATLPIASPAWATPLLHDSHLWIGSGSELCCIDWLQWLNHPQQPEEAIRWRQQMPGEGVSATPVVWDGRLFVVTFDTHQSRLRCFDPDSGQGLHHQELCPGPAGDPLAFDEAIGLFGESSITWFERGLTTARTESTPRPLRTGIRPATGAGEGLLSAVDPDGNRSLLRVLPGQLQDCGDRAQGAVQCLSADEDGCFIASSGGLEYMPWGQPTRNCNLPEPAVAVGALGNHMALTVMSHDIHLCSSDGLSYGALNSGSDGLALVTTRGQRALLIFDGKLIGLHWTRQEN